MALNREVWIDQVKEGFYPDDRFLQKATDYSQFVDHNRLHIASAGIDPKVLVNNTTYPISVIGRDDEDNEIRLDKFETENTIVRRPEALEYSYDKLESVIGQHRSTLRASVATKAAHAYAPAEDTENTPVIITTGESITGRKRLRFADILALKERFDDVDVPLDERYLVLHPKHVSDLLLEDLKLFKDLTSIKDGEPLKFAGFGCYAFSRMPTYRMMDGVLKKVAFGAAAAEGDRFASFAFYAKEVMKADGDIHMYATENDPKERVTIVGFDKRFVALPIRGKGIGSGKLGTPTLNQNYPAAALQPCAGVYLTRIYLDGQWRPAATGIGKRPTVDSSENAAVTCETFVPDFSGNVYGQQPVLEFHKYFCPVRKFNSMDELAALIHHAADESKAYFAALNGAK